MLAIFGMEQKTALCFIKAEDGWLDLLHLPSKITI
jgi:hypothetical protein